MEAVEFSFMPHVGGPCLAAVKSTEHAGLVDMQSGFLSEVGVVPHSLVQFGHDCGCLGEPAVDLRVDGQ